jgi:hypothetical protein
MLTKKNKATRVLAAVAQVAALAPAAVAAGKSADE